MPSVNKVHLLGNVGRDPEVRYAPSGAAVCNVSLATTNQWKDKQSGERMQETQWHRVTFYERLAEVVGEYVKKGDPIYIEGSIKYGKYTDKDGVERNTVEIVARELQLLGGRRDSDGGQDGGQPRGRQAAPSPAPAPRGAPQRSGAPAPYRAPQSRGGSTGFDDMDSDIPF